MMIVTDCGGCDDNSDIQGPTMSRAMRAPAYSS